MREADQQVFGLIPTAAPPYSPFEATAFEFEFDGSLSGRVEQLRAEPHDRELPAVKARNGINFGRTVDRVPLFIRMRDGLRGEIDLRVPA